MFKHSILIIDRLIQYNKLKTTIVELTALTVKVTVDDIDVLMH